MRLFGLMFILLLLPLFTYSQQPRLLVEGSVHGYKKEPAKGIFKRPKSPTLEGSLDNAFVSVLKDGQLVTEVQTNASGSYELQLEFGELYTFKVSRENYNTNLLLLDTRALPKDVRDRGYRFVNLEFILNSYGEGNKPEFDRNLGRLYYKPSQSAWQLADAIPNDDEVDAPLQLLQRAISKNNDRIEQGLGYVLKTNKKGKYSDINNTKTNTSDTTSSPSKSSQDYLTISSGLSYPLEDPYGNNLEERQKRIQEAKDQLALDKLLSKTRYDSLTILEREAQIQLAEREIENARLLIDQQNSTLQAQRYSVTLLTILLAVVGGTLLLIYYFYRQRQRSSQLIEEKNRQITDSLSYAKKIQQSVFTDEQLLKSSIPESFLLNLPRDIVSGDFFFFHSYQDKFILGVADCTGHGVPGAFMSLIGNRLLREVIIEREIYDPSMILQQLDQGLQESFSGQTSGSIIDDGMDIAICQVDPANQTITYAAAMNPAYLVSGEDIQVIQADVASVGGQLRKKRKRIVTPKAFTNKAIRYEPGSMLYLFSDGYMDQFGELEDEKFNTRRFKDMILSVNDRSAELQAKVLLNQFNEWKGNLNQTDDVMVMGIRLP